MTAEINPVARQKDVVVQELKDELLLYNLKTNKAYCLNETSALVYQLCDGNNSVAEIVLEISKKLKRAVMKDLIWLAIDQLKKENLLENSFEIETKFAAFSRREAIKRIGFASIVTLPVISSLAAPTAATAASAAACIKEGQPCNISDECCVIGGFQNCQEDCFTGVKTCVSGVVFCP